MDKIKQEDIEEICFNVSQNIILPKFKNLSDDDINYKNGSDLVTAADIEAEKELKKNKVRIWDNKLENVFGVPNIASDAINYKKPPSNPNFSSGSVNINCDSPVWKNKPRCN